MLIKIKSRIYAAPALKGLMEDHMINYKFEHLLDHDM